MIIKNQGIWKKNPISSYIKKRICSQEEMQTLIALSSNHQCRPWHSMSYNLNFHWCSSLKARKLTLSDSGLVTLNTSELTTVTAPSQYSRIKVMNFLEPAESNPIPPYPATSVTLEKQLTAHRPKSLLETRLMCYIWCTSGEWKTSLEHSKQVSRNSSTRN